MSVFAYRAPTKEERELLEELQRYWLATEEAIMRCVPEGRERALAITKLQECRMWSNAGVVLVREP